MFLTRFLGLSSKSSQSAPPAQLTRLKSRLGCEMLEARDVPAAFYWNPLLSGGMVNANVDVASNWTDMSGVRQTAAPVSADDLYFTGYSQPGSSGPSYPGANAVIKSADINQPVVRTYNSIHLLAGYTGTVDFKVSTYVGILELRGGNIAQNDAFYATAGGGHLTVRVHFDWTGGTLNSGPTAGWVHLEGATGIIDPGDGNTVNTRSTLNLMKNASDVMASTTQRRGFIDFLDGNGMIVGETCQVELKVKPIPAGNPNAIVGYKGTQTTTGDLNRKYIHVKKDAKVIVARDPEDANNPAVAKGSSELPILIDGGQLSLLENTDFSVFGSLNTCDSGLPAVTVYQKSGTTLVTNGSELFCGSGFSMLAGEFQTIALTVVGVPIANQPDAVLHGDFSFNGGNLRLVYNLPMNDNSASTFGRLKIKGDMNYNGGTYHPRFNPTTRKADLIYVEGDGKKMSIYQDARVSPNRVTHNWTGSAPGDSYPILRAPTEIVGAPAITAALDAFYKLSLDLPGKKAINLVLK